MRMDLLLLIDIAFAVFSVWIMSKFDPTEMPTRVSNYVLLSFLAFVAMGVLRVWYNTLSINVN